LGGDEAGLIQIDIMHILWGVRMNENEQRRLGYTGYICVNMKKENSVIEAFAESNDMFFDKREKPVVGKSSIPEEAVRNSPFIIKKIEQAKRRLNEVPFPIELLDLK
jgi:hypothetical protein